MKDSKPKDKSSIITSVVDLEINEAKTKELVKDLKMTNVNLKNICSLMHAKWTASAQKMLKTDSNFEEKSKTLDCKCESEDSFFCLYDVLFNFVLLK